MALPDKSDYIGASINGKIDSVDTWADEVVGGNFKYNVLVLLTRISQALDPEGKTITQPTTWEWRKSNVQKH